MSSEKSEIKSSTIRVTAETKEKLESLKVGNESVNTIILNLLMENEKLNHILGNIESLKEYLRK